VSSSLSEGDLRLTAEGDVLEIVSRYGGEVIVAGPVTERMVGELADLVIKWHRGDRP
jgi:hypothetical protein